MHIFAAVRAAVAECRALGLCWGAGMPLAAGLAPLWALPAGLAQPRAPQGMERATLGPCFR